MSGDLQKVSIHLLKMSIHLPKMSGDLQKMDRFPRYPENWHIDLEGRYEIF